MTHREILDYIKASASKLGHILTELQIENIAINAINNNVIIEANQHRIGVPIRYAFDQSSLLECIKTHLPTSID